MQAKKGQLEAMLFYMQMKWNVEGRLSFDQLWDLEVKDAMAAQEAGIEIVSIYKVAGQRRVLAVIEMDSATDIDRLAMGQLPMREFLEFEAIWPLREFGAFIEDCKTGWRLATDIAIPEPSTAQKP